MKEPEDDSGGSGLLVIDDQSSKGAVIKTAATMSKASTKDGDTMDVKAGQPSFTATKGLVDVPLDSPAKGHPKDAVSEQVQSSPAKAMTVEPAKEQSSIKLKMVQRELETNMEHTPGKKNEQGARHM